MNNDSDRDAPHTAAPVHILVVPEKGREMTTDKVWDPETHGVVGHYSQGGFGLYHRQNCGDAPHRGAPGVRDTIHAPWKYLAAHWRPCPDCRPPVELGSASMAA
jgi:hypothetical protein